MKWYTLISSLVLMNLVEMRQLPSFVQKCKYTNSEELSKCIKQRTIDFIPRLAKGMPELKMPPIDPVFIPKIDIDAGTGLHLVFRNVTINGFIDTKIIDYFFDIERKVQIIHFFIPSCHVYSICDMKAKLPLITIDTSGTGRSDIAGIEVIGEWNFSLVKKNGKTYLKLSNEHKEEIKYEKASVQFEKLFGENAELTETINQLLNENLSELSKNIDPLIYQSVTSLVGRILQNFWDEYSLEEAFDDYSDKN